MRKLFLLIVVLIPVALFAEAITRINKELPVLVKVQDQGKVYKCNVTLPGIPDKAIKEANVVYSLDNKGNFMAALEMGGQIIDVAHCVSNVSKMAFYKKLIDTAAKEAKEGKKELSRFVEDAIDPYIKFQIESASK